MKTMTNASKKSPKTPIVACSILAIDLGKFKSIACARSGSDDCTDAENPPNERMTDIKLIAGSARRGF